MFSFIKQIEIVFLNFNLTNLIIYFNVKLILKNEEKHEKNYYTAYTTSYYLDIMIEPLTQKSLIQTLKRMLWIGYSNMAVKIHVAYCR